MAKPADTAETGAAPAGPDLNNIPVAPVARPEDVSGSETNAAPATNAPPPSTPTPPGAGTAMP
jgi:hypothetical protein